MKNKEALRNAKSFDELLDLKYGKVATAKRDAYEVKANYFVACETLKEDRKQTK